jgi:hypothetical protein
VYLTFYVLRFAAVESGVERDGHIYAPKLPGVGFDVDAADIERRAVARL